MKKERWQLEELKDKKWQKPQKRTRFLESAAKRRLNRFYIYTKRRNNRSTILIWAQKKKKKTPEWKQKSSVSDKSPVREKSEREAPECFASTAAAVKTSPETKKLCPVSDAPPQQLRPSFRGSSVSAFKALRRPESEKRTKFETQGSFKEIKQV